MIEFCLPGTKRRQKGRRDEKILAIAKWTFAVMMATFSDASISLIQHASSIFVACQKMSIHI